MNAVLKQAAQVRAERHKKWLSKLRRRLNEQMTAHPGLFQRGDRIYLFGSQANNSWDQYSDIDVLAILAEPPSVERHADGVFCCLQKIADDVLVLTQSEYVLRVHAGSCFWGEVHREKMLVLEVAAATS